MKAGWVALAALLALVVLVDAREQLSSVRIERRSLPAGSGTISGVVRTEKGSPAVGASVAVKAPARWSMNHQTDASQPLEARTDAAGRFTLENLPDEPLELSASLDGFLTAVYGEVRPGLPGTPIRLAAGARLNVALRLARPSSISGTVLDHDGQPAPGVNVYAFRLETMSDGESLMGSGGEAKTNERGEYRMTGLLPGKYLVTAYRMWPGDGLPPILTLEPGQRGVESGVWYPDAAEASSAEPLEIDLGHERSGIDMRIPRLPITTLSGTVVGTDGRPVANADVRYVEVSDPILSVSDSHHATTGADGRFAFSRVKPGDYQVVAFTKRPAEPSWGRSTVKSDGKAPESVMVELRPTATVAGRVIFAGQSARPSLNQYSYLFLNRVFLSHRHDTPGVRESYAWPEFTFQGVPPGRYIISPRLGDRTGTWTPASIMINGRDTLDFPFEISGDEHIENVTITFSDQKTELSGTVLDRNGVPFVDCTVVVFASDERFWTPASLRIDRIRPDTRGRYAVYGLPAGEYLVALAPPDLFGRPPASLPRDLRPRATRVTLGAGERRTHDVQNRR